MPKTTSLIFSFFFLCTTHSLKAQDTDSSRFSIGGSFAPNLGFYHLDYAPEFQGFIDSRKKLDEQAWWGYSAGVLVRYKISNKFELETGIHYFRFAFKAYGIPVYQPLPENPTTGYEKVDFIRRTDYLEIPLRVNYRIIDHSFYVYLSAGFSYDILVNNGGKGKLYRSDGSSTIKKWNNQNSDLQNPEIFSVLGGFGLGYAISNRIDLRCEPLFKYQLEPNTKDAPIKEYQYAGLLQFSASWNF